MMRQKSILIISLIIVFSIIGIGSVLFVKTGTDYNVSGWLWGGTTEDDFNKPEKSTGVGWISTHNLGEGDLYGIYIPSSDGSVSGYAWSENIGWIDFQPPGPYPAEPSYSAKREGDKLTGWARILSIKEAADNNNSGGWQGWIKLSGTAQDGSLYGVKIDPVTGKLSGYAWSDELGWISFEDNNVLANFNSTSTSTSTSTPNCTFSANPKMIKGTGTSTLSWDCKDADSCTIDQGIGSVSTTGTYVVELENTTTYTLSCSNNEGASGSWQVKIIVFRVHEVFRMLRHTKLAEAVEAIVSSNIRKIAPR